MRSSMTKLRKYTLLLICTLIFTGAFAGMPDKVLVGYWENWRTLRIKDIDPRYNVIMLSFLEADKDWNVTNNVVGDLEFTPSTSKSTIKADIATVQAKGKKVLISIGGANGSFKLNNTTDKETFVSIVKDFIIEYGVDGIDIDIEQTTYSCMSSGTLSNPETHHQLLIDGIKDLLSWHQSTYGKKMLLTTAPETLYIQGGLSQWANCGGSFLPFLEQLNDDLDLVMVQLYNSGEMFDLDLNPRQQGTQAFVVSQTEAVIRGFRSAQGFGDYSGTPANKVVVALPADCSAGGGYLSSSDMVAAVKYLMGTGPKVGGYTLKKSSGYGDLRGMMTWSINTDKNSSCGSYGFADATEEILGPIGVEDVEKKASFNVYPNPANDQIQITGLKANSEVVKIIDAAGKTLMSQAVSGSSVSFDLNGLSSGFYTVSVDGQTEKLVIN